MVNSGKLVELHYKEFLGAIPWRGYSNFVVDSILPFRNRFIEHVSEQDEDDGCDKDEGGCIGDG